MHTTSFCVLLTYSLSGCLGSSAPSTAFAGSHRQAPRAISCTPSRSRPIIHSPSAVPRRACRHLEDGCSLYPSSDGGGLLDRSCSIVRTEAVRPIYGTVRPPWARHISTPIEPGELPRPTRERAQS